MVYFMAMLSRTSCLCVRLSYRALYYSYLITGAL